MRKTSAERNMPINLSEVQVIHNPNENRFEATVDGYPSKLDYIQDGKNFVITHVGVHPELRGQGIAGRIVEVSLAYAKENKLRVVPMCSCGLHPPSEHRTHDQDAVNE
jgi:predicted GNAT family acetyltransferase